MKLPTVRTRNLLLAVGLALLSGCASVATTSTTATTAPAALIPATTAPAARAPEVFSVATYNVENWRNNFAAEKLEKSGELGTSPAARDTLRQLRAANDENNWEVSRVLLELAPDIVMFQEAASLEDLKAFNTRWLENAYATVHVFATNSGRGQNLAMMLKPGFSIVEIREEYHKEPDPDPTGRTSGGEESGVANQPRLFARGPGFALIQTPSGDKVWVGNTHQKSKSGNSVDVTRWRNREAVRTHDILRELRATGHPVIFTGDFNDELGVQEFEAGAGGSTVEKNAGPAGGGFTLATRQLHDKNLISFQGYFRNRYRSLIDHFVISDDLAPALVDVRIDRSPFAEVASDHLPVIATFDLRHRVRP